MCKITVNKIMGYKNLRLLAGNVISFIAAVFMGVAAASKKRRTMFIFQMLDCLFLGVAQLVFGVPSAATVLFFGVLRNIAILKQKYSLFVMLSFLITTVIVGILSNASGLLGIIPIAATAIITVGCYFAKTHNGIKGVFMANLGLWTIYSVLIFDFVTATVNFISFILSAVSTIGKKKEKYAVR